MFALFFADRDDPALVENGPYKPFSVSHIFVTLIAFILVYLMVRQIKNRPFKTRHKWACAAYIFLVSLNVVRLTWDISTEQFEITQDLPLQLCGIQMFVLPIVLFSRGRFSICLREFAYTYGIIGFLLALLLPLTTLYDYPVFHFRTIQSILYHAALGFIAFMLPHLDYQPDIKNVHAARVRRFYRCSQLFYRQ
ncbi:MAG: hypothetical protein ACOX8Q_04620 [Christensenellales bacterium]